MALYQNIFENNKTWVHNTRQADPDFFARLAEGQHPEILYIGCSDSRVTAEDMTGIHPGEMFVHRNIANLVPNNDSSGEAVIEYAVNHLQVKHIVVCGHYGCGGVKAAMQPRDLGILNPWLRNIRDVYRLHKQTLNAIADETERYQRLTELNVQEQCVNVIKKACWQKSFLRHGYPTVHGWVFDISTGLLKDLNIDMESIAREIREIYDLNPLDRWDRARRPVRARPDKQDFNTACRFVMLLRTEGVRYKGCQQQHMRRCWSAVCNRSLRRWWPCCAPAAKRLGPKLSPVCRRAVMCPTVKHLAWRGP